MLDPDKNEHFNICTDLVAKRRAKVITGYLCQQNVDTKDAIMEIIQNNITVYTHLGIKYQQFIYVCCSKYRPK